MEGLRKIGDPRDFTRKYYESGADEISYQDTVASLFGRNSISELVTDSARSVFIPITVGGGVRSVDDAIRLIRSGADKICVNSAAVRDPQLIRDLSRVLGRQAVVAGIEAKRNQSGWEAMTDCGREHSGLGVLDWIVELESLGAGEIFLTSIDHEGTRKGFDTELIAQCREVSSLPLIAHGGAGAPMDAVRAYEAGADAVALATLLHVDAFTVEDFKAALSDHGVEVRQ